jgi:hypothetical protein
MTTIPTPAEFLASSEPDEDEAMPHPIDHPLHLIAQSLQRMADAADQQPIPAVLESAPCTDCADLRDEVQVLRSLHTEMGHSYADAVALVEQIEGIVKKSTSQVSLAVKAAIEAWRTPATDVDTAETPSPAPGAPAVDEAAAGPLVQAPEQDVPQASAGEGLQQPAHDAPVEEWRTYARFLGQGRTGPAFNELEAMNRSQIRTMLGVEQPVTAAGA